MLVLHSPQHCTIYPQATSLHIAQGHKPIVQNSQLAPPHATRPHTNPLTPTLNVTHTISFTFFMQNFYFINYYTLSHQLII